MKSFNNNELLAYLDEALPAETMAAIEDALRQDTKLTARLTELIAKRDSGTHSLGEIWRRCRLSCAPREQLGSHLLGILPDEENSYITFHIETVGCRYCQANLADLKAQQSAAADRAHSEKTGQRRKKILPIERGAFAICKTLADC